MSQTLFSYALRLISCANCGAPLDAPGQSVTCPYCGATNALGPRNDARDRQLAGAAPQMSEAQRYERLRAQDKQPLQPPPTLQHLVHQGGLAPESEPAARAEWQRARHELMHGATYGAAERLYFLTLLLYGHLSKLRDDRQIRALLETALEHLNEPRHRQVVHGMLARNAARVGDLEAAEQWLALCTPHSDDLHMDTAYRFSRAFASSRRGDFATVLRALGSQIDDVPIADGSDHVCAVLRANALERSGRVPEAVQQLSTLMLQPGGAELVSNVIRFNPELGLCPHAFPMAQQQQQQVTQNLVKTKSGVRAGLVFLVAFGCPMLGLGAAALLDALGVRKNDTIIVVAVIAYVILLLGTIIRVFTAGARVRARLSKTGIRGQAQVLSATETGTRVNDQPVVQLLLQVTAPGIVFCAEHNEIISSVMVHRITPGSVLPVLFDPHDPSLLVVEWS